MSDVKAIPSNCVRVTKFTSRSNSLLVTAEHPHEGFHAGSDQGCVDVYAHRFLALTDIEELIESLREAAKIAGLR